MDPPCGIPYSVSVPACSLGSPETLPSSLDGWEEDGQGMAFCCFSAYTSLGSSTVNKGWVSLSYMAGRLPIPDRNNQAGAFQFLHWEGLTWEQRTQAILNDFMNRP